MPVTDSDKVDFLWKKVIFGTSTTADPSLKGGSNETVASPLPVYANLIWSQSDQIPSTPGSTGGVVTAYTGSSRIRCTADPTVSGSPAPTWFATSTFGTIGTRLGDWIPASFDPAYAIQVYIGDPNGGPAALLPPDTTNEEWVFDYTAGVIHFPNGAPSGSKTATVGSGSVTIASNGIYIVGRRYTGTKGVAGAGTTSRNFIVANIAARNALSATAGDTAYVQDASAIATDAGAGEYAIYIWTGSAWSLLATQDSARTDAKTSVANVTTPINNPYSLGFAGDNTRVVSVIVTVTTPFDQATNLGVGTSSNNELLVAGSETDLSGLGTFVIYPNYVFPVETLIGVYLTAVGTAPTVGAATVTITYA